MSEKTLIDKYLRHCDGVVGKSSVDKLNNALGGSDRFILIMGNCAEVMDDISVEYARKFGSFYKNISNDINNKTGKNVLKIGRFAGQFGKTRSQDFDRDGGAIYRGDIYNDYDAKFRGYDDFRKIIANHKSVIAVNGEDENIFTAHEIFDFEYEEALIRNMNYASSCHLLWLGNKNFASKAHVEFLSKIKNPIGIKVGGGVEVEQLRDLIAKLKEFHIDKEVVLISRLGCDDIEKKLPMLLKATRGMEVVWICDPMHGNNKRLPNGSKVRFLDEISRELKVFREIYEDIYESNIQGMMLEAWFGDFVECLDNAQDARSQRYESYCDPRLNREQVIQLIETAL